MLKARALLSLFVVALISTALISPPAEAKRFGGGASFGKSYKYSKPVQRKAIPSTPSRSAAQQSNLNGAKAGAAQRSRGGMMGMLGGLAAGGLLGALFFGGAFENINLFDILLLGGLAFAGVALFRAMRRGREAGGASASAWQREAPAGATAGAANAGYQRESTTSTGGSGSGFAVPEIGSGLKGETLSVKPEWFDEHAFMAEATNHFMALQEAWDSGDLSRIREYTTPELFEMLRQERAKYPGKTQTRIIDLQPQLIDLLQDGDQVVAAILFQGYEQEGDSEPEAFADIWHVEHPLDNPSADWLLAGIRKLDEID